MKIAVLVADYGPTNHILKYVDAARDPAAADKRNLHTYDVIQVHKASAVKQVLELESTRKYDVFMNLCEAVWEDDVAGAEVVQTLHKINAAYTGADPIFYNLSKQAMKIAANSCGVLIPNHKFLDHTDDLIRLKSRMTLTMPVIVKHPTGHDSVGLSEESVVNSMDGLEKQVTKMIREFRGALVEEFIAGPEYTVLVAQNPQHQGAEPWAFLPVECEFYDENYKFKYFDVKWRTHHTGMGWKPVNDRKLAERLKNAAKQVFLACSGTGYARADFRMDSKTGEIYFLEINANCSVFYDSPGNFGSADYIMHLDPDGPEKFIDIILETAIKKREKRRKNVKIDYEPTKGFYLVANEDFEPGQVLVTYEYRPTYLVSRKFVEKHWKINEPTKADWIEKYGYQISNNVFYTWHENTNEDLPFNHSCDPNCWLEGLDVVARRSIKNGDDVTLDYATFAFLDHASYKNEFECFCGTKSCRKIIQPSSDYKLPGFAETFRGHLSDFIETKLINLVGT